MASFKNIRQRQDFDLSNFLPRALQYKNCLAIFFDISKTFYNDWLSWCEIIKGFRTKFVPLSCNSQNRVFRLCLKTSLPHHTSRFLALNEWFFAFATNGDIQFGDKFRPQCTFVARTSIQFTTLTLKALFVQKLVIGIWVIAQKLLLMFWDFWQNKNLLNSCNKGN